MNFEIAGIKLDITTELKDYSAVEAGDNLRGFNRTTKVWVNEVAATLNREGWNLLGAGCFSQVFGHAKHSYVIRVIGDDPGAIEWLKFCSSAFRSCPLLPAVFDLVAFKAGCGVAVMERLQGERGDVLEKKMDLSDSVIRLQQKITMPPILKETVKTPEMADKLTAAYGIALAQLTTESRYTCKRAKHDLHIGNMMCRANGQLVITDPIATWWKD